MSEMTFDEAARIARVHANVARAMIEMNAMTAENMQRQALGHSMAYDESAFLSIIDECGIGYNSVELDLYPHCR